MTCRFMSIILVWFYLKYVLEKKIIRLKLEKKHIHQDDAFNKKKPTIPIVTYVRIFPKAVLDYTYNSLHPSRLPQVAQI